MPWGPLSTVLGPASQVAHVLDLLPLSFPIIGFFSPIRAFHFPLFHTSTENPIAVLSSKHYIGSIFMALDTDLGEVVYDLLRRSF